MRRSFIKIIFFLVFSIMMMPANAAVGDQVIITSPIASTVNSNNSERDDEALYGTVGEIVADLNSFQLYQVKLQYGYTTWIRQKDLVVDTQRANQWKKNVTHIVAVPFADVVPRPSTQSYPPILTLPKGAYLQIDNPNETGRYYTLTLVDGSNGYIRKNSVRPLLNWNSQGEQITRKQIVEDALSYSGAAYRWGGKTMEGIDCSGFASIVYMINGLDIYRNASPDPGYPIALMHIEGTQDNQHTLSTLAKAKPGDFIYWEGHQGIYLGNGKYIHANGSSFDTRINSLIAGDPDYRADLGTPSSIYAWGTAFPEYPAQLIVRQFRAENIGVNEYRFYGKVDGYTPNRGILYPEGKGEGKPQIAIEDPEYMLYENPKSTSTKVPVYRYTKPGTYYPVIEWINDKGWRPEEKTIIGEGTLATPIVVL